jgi:predicted GIY-YIG superfamily endonuclease
MSEGFGSEVSRYKIAIMTKHGEANWYWYCFKTENNKPYTKMRDEMIKRLKTHLQKGKHPCTVQSLCVYERTIFIEKLPTSVLI